MSYNWGPHYIVPSEIFKTYSGSVQLREEFDEDLLRKAIKTVGICRAYRQDNQSLVLPKEEFQYVD